MNGKIAAVLLSGLLFACVQAPPPEPVAPPPACPGPRSAPGRRRSGAGPAGRGDSRAAHRRYPGCRLRGAAGIGSRRSYHGRDVLYRLSGIAFRVENHQRRQNSDHRQDGSQLLRSTPRPAGCRSVCPGLPPSQTIIDTASKGSRPHASGAVRILNSAPCKACTRIFMIASSLGAKQARAP